MLTALVRFDTVLVRFTAVAVVAKQFKTSVALPWSLPNHQDSPRFTTVLLRVTTVHDDFTNRGES